MKTAKYITIAGVALAAAVFATASSFAGVVPIDEPGLVLKGRTLADVQANEISGDAIGTHMRPRNMVGFNKTMLQAADGQPARLRVEMQMMDSYHLKCIVLELTDGAGGVYGRAVAARYVLTKDHGLGWKFVNADGSLNGTAHPLGDDPKGEGYGLADLTLVPRDIDVGCDSQRSRGTRDPTDDARQIEAARGVIARFAGEEIARQLALEIIPLDAGRPVFEVLEKGRRIRASNGATLCKAFYTDVTRKGAGICSWSGNRFDADVWKNGTPNDDLRVVSPFRRHLYMQPCTASYTTAFWDEARWMREIDWMALHGYDLPNAVTAFEAILERVWKKHGLTDAEIEASFAGPAYLAFSRMSCVDNAISHLPAAWRKRSVPLQHAICRRLRSLGMDVMAQGFAGAVPAGLKRVHPNAEMEQLTWARRYHSWFLYPDDPLFVQIGAEIVREWEKEFGKGEYYLCDSFIEMSRSMPWLKDGDEATLKGLETCGRNIYGALKAANPDAVWALQGWIFYNAPNVWTKDRADAFLSAVPADKMLLVDNCVDNYNMHRQRHFQWNWVKYDAYNGRRWAWSPIPDFGGNTVPCGDLPFYANGHLSAIASGKRGALYAFGTMTEAIEVQDDIFEVLSAAGWRDYPIDLVDWLERYSLGRWGMDGAEVRKYWQQMLASVYGNGEYINMGAKFRWQRNPARFASGRQRFPEMFASLKTLRGLAAKAGDNPLFRRDFAVQTAHMAGRAADLLYASGKPEDAVRGDRLLEGIDAVLAGHPTHDLRNWITKARSCADGDEKLADYYETDARRIITVWAPGLGDYAARVWSGLVAGYYLPRLRLAREGKSKEISVWQNKWVEERLPIAPPAPGWTCEKLVDELLAAWDDLNCAEKSPLPPVVWHMAVEVDGVEKPISIESEEQTFEKRQGTFSFGSLKAGERTFDICVTLNVKETPVGKVYTGNVANNEKGTRIVKFNGPKFDCVSIDPAKASLYIPKGLGRRMRHFPVGGEGSGDINSFTTIETEIYPYSGLTMPWVALDTGNATYYAAAYDRKARVKSVGTRWYSRRRQVDLRFRHPLSIRAGERWKMPEMVFEKVSGDWHDAAKRYRAWYDSTHPAVRSAAPDWTRDMVGLLLVIMRQQNELLMWPYTDIPKLCDVAERNGLDCIGLYGWTVGGHDHLYPDYDPDPKMGGIPALKAGIAEAHRRGIRVYIYANGQLQQVGATKFWDAYGKNIAITRRDGSPYVQTYHKYKDIPVYQFALGCLYGPPWRERMFSLACQAESFGADAIIYDQMGAQRPYECWGRGHGHPTPWSSHAEERPAFLRGIADEIRKRNPSFSVYTEGLHDSILDSIGFFHSYTPGTFKKDVLNVAARDEAPPSKDGDAFPELFRYTFPEAVLTTRFPTPMAPRYMANYAVVFGLRHEIEIRYMPDREYVLDGKVPTSEDYGTVRQKPDVDEMRATPPATASAYLKAVCDFQKRHAKYLLRGRFVDEEGFTIGRAGSPLPAANALIAKRYLADDGTSAVCVWNISEKPVDVVIGGLGKPKGVYEPGTDNATSSEIPLPPDSMRLYVY